MANVGEVRYTFTGDATQLRAEIARVRKDLEALQAQAAKGVNIGGVGGVGGKKGPPGTVKGALGFDGGGIADILLLGSRLGVFKELGTILSTVAGSLGTLGISATAAATGVGAVVGAVVLFNKYSKETEALALAEAKAFQQVAQAAQDIASVGKSLSDENIPKFLEAMVPPAAELKTKIAALNDELLKLTREGDTEGVKRVKQELENATKLYETRSTLEQKAANARLKAEEEITRAVAKGEAARLEAQGQTLAAQERQQEERLRLHDKETTETAEKYRKLYEGQVDGDKKVTDYLRGRSDERLAIETKYGNDVKKVYDEIGEAFRKSQAARTDSDIGAGLQAPGAGVTQGLEQELQAIEKRKNEALKALEGFQGSVGEASKKRREIETTALNDIVIAERNAAKAREAINAGLVQSVSKIVDAFGDDRRFSKLKEQLDISKEVTAAKGAIDTLTSAFRQGVIDGGSYKNLVREIQDNLRKLGATGKQIGSTLSEGAKDALGSYRDFRDTIVESEGVFKQAGEGVGEFKTSLEGIGPTTDEVAESLQRAQEASQRWYDTFAQVDTALTDVVANVGNLEQETESVADSTEAIAENAQEASQALQQEAAAAGQAATQVQALDQAQEDAAASAAALDDELTGHSVVPSLKEAANAAAEAAKGQERYHDSTIALTTDIARMESLIQTLRESEKQSGQEIERTTQAVSQQQQALTGLAGATQSVSLSLAQLLAYQSKGIRTLNAGLFSIDIQKGIFQIVEQMRAEQQAQKMVQDFLDTTFNPSKGKSLGSKGFNTLGTGGGGPMRRFETGGVVPGPIGRPQFAVVHGGEEVLTPEERRARDQSRSTTIPSVQVTVPVSITGVVGEEVLQQIDRRLADAVRRGASESWQAMNRYDGAGQAPGRGRR